MVKVSIIHNIIAPYRIPLFRELAKRSMCDELIVYYCIERYKDRLWDIEQKESYYKSKVLSGFTFNIPVINIPCSINPYMIKKIFKKDFDLIIINGLSDFTTQFALFGCILVRRPVILWSELTGSFLSKHKKYYLPLIKFFIKIPDAFIVPSIQAKEFHINMGVSPEKIFLAPNMIDEKKYYKMASKYKKNIDTIKMELGMSNKKIILFVGRLIERKGIKYLLEAYEKLKDKNKDLSLVIIGDGPLKNQLNYLCNKKKIDDVYFTGFLNEEDIIKYYSISDVLVLPSTWELHPLVISEAMSCGTPVITTKAASNALDMIENSKNGFIIDEKSVKQLERSIDYTLKNSDEMGKEALKTINEQFSLSNSANGFISAIKFAIRGN